MSALECCLAKRGAAACRSAHCKQTCEGPLMVLTTSQVGSRCDTEKPAGVRVGAGVGASLSASESARRGSYGAPKRPGGPARCAQRDPGLRVPSSCGQLARANCYLSQGGPGPEAEVDATPIVEASNLVPSLRASVHTRAEATPEERTLRVEGYRANKPTIFGTCLTRHLKILAYVPLTKKAH